MIRALLIALLLASMAHADQPHCRLERLDPAPLKEDQLRLYASVVELEGTVQENFSAGQFALKIDGKAVGKAEKLQTFAAAREEVDIALVVEGAVQYKRDMDRVKEALKDFLDEQPPQMKVSLITYGSELSRPSKPVSAPAMSNQLDNLEPDDDSGDVRMADALRLALAELKKLEPSDPSKVPPRRLIVLVSDGLNARMDRPTFRKLGEEAAHAGVPIHTIAFSPIDERGPLLNLGELSKRSNGTFRWAKSASDLKDQLDTLADEVRKQYVLTFKTSLSSTEKHSFGLMCGNLKSNVLGGRGKFGFVVASSTGLRWYWWTLIGLAVFCVFMFVLAGVRMKQRTALAMAGGAPAPVRGAVVARPTPAKVVAAAAAGGQTRSGSVTLIAVSGPLAGQRLPLSDGITIGKGAGNTLVVAGDATVSTRHCEMRLEGGWPVLQDLGSTNGTFVNGNRITAPQRLRDGDLVRCGVDTQFKIRID